MGLADDGEEATVVFEGAGVFDAVLVELPQEARSRGRIANAALRRRPLERNERKTFGPWDHLAKGMERYIVSKHTPIFDMRSMENTILFSKPTL